MEEYERSWAMDDEADGGEEAAPLPGAPDGVVTAATAQGETRDAVEAGFCAEDDDDDGDGEEEEEEVEVEEETAVAAGVQEAGIQAGGPALMRDRSPRAPPIAIGAGRAPKLPVRAPPAPPLLLPRCG